MTIVDLPDLGLLENVAQNACFKARQVWAFIHVADAPDNLDTMVRTWVLQGARTSSIVGAIVIAAQRPQVAPDQQLAYANGVLRREFTDVETAEQPEPKRRWWHRFRRSS